MKPLICTVSIGLLSVTGAVLAATASDAEQRQPNVVIFLTDDQGTVDVNCYGSEDLYTPAMDSLAETGVRFTQAYAHQVCCPTRAMLLTGRYPQRGGVTHWTQGNAKDTTLRRNMALEEITLAEVLREAGYSTALFGKWHLGAHLDYGPTKQGFDVFWGIRGGFIDNYNHHFLHQEGFHDLYEGTEEVFADGEYFPDLATDRALQYIDAHQDVPFFLYMAFNIPHYPEQPDPKFDERYQDMEMPRQLYAKMISTTDDHMGRILERLEQHGLTDDTIVVFMSDNGHSRESPAIKVDNHSSGLAKGTYYGTSGGGSAGKWRGQKASFFEGGLRVPAIISYPPAVPQGEVRDQAITAMDWMPTILELCEIPLPDVELDGASVLPVIESATAESHYDAIHWHWGKRWAVLKGPWKLVGKGGDGDFLGNLEDPQPEKTNHLKANPEIADALLQLQRQWMSDVQSTH
jgi:arylsulfatase A-like enzyme